MRASRLIAVVLFLGLIAAGCGFSPPSPPPTSSATCTQADGPSADTVAAEIAKLPAANWSEIVSGHTADCSLHWVVVSSGDASDSPGQVLFFDRKSPIGTPTPDPRPYITISATANDSRRCSTNGVRAKSRRAALRASPRSGSKSRTASSRRSIPFPTHSYFDLKKG